MGGFLNREYCIHIRSAEEARVVFEYYYGKPLPTRTKSGISEENCLQFPYLVASPGRLGGNMEAYDYVCHEFPEWYASHIFGLEFDPAGDEALLTLLEVK